MTEPKIVTATGKSIGMAKRVKPSQKTDYPQFLEKIRNPVSKCVMHDDATNAADLIELWKGLATRLHNAIVADSTGAVIGEYAMALHEESRFINSLSWQGTKKD
jgi:hypothetical protein